MSTSLSPAEDDDEVLDDEDFDEDADLDDEDPDADEDSDEEDDEEEETWQVFGSPIGLTS
ncbi:MAG: hypothetical protein ND807_06955 [Vicinamibacterales bacterium]|nr:hypothetical protein [Vicinamibacterales bacterium]